jgi:hypothetical protein
MKGTVRSGVLYEVKLNNTDIVFIIIRIFNFPHPTTQASGQRSLTIVRSSMATPPQAQRTMVIVYFALTKRNGSMRKMRPRPFLRSHRWLMLGLTTT